MRQLDPVEFLGSSFKGCLKSGLHQQTDSEVEDDCRKEGNPRPMRLKEYA